MSHYSSKTSNCDFYLAIHENGINRVINRAMKYLPSFFNYGSPYMTKHLQLACNNIMADPSVVANGDPLISKLDLPIPTNLSLPLNIQLPLSPDFIFQLLNLAIDFYPGNAISLPSTIQKPLPAQQLAIHAETSAGLSCPSEENEFDCFCLDFFVELGLKKPPLNQFLNIFINSLDVTEIKPDGLRKLLDCYAKDLGNQALNWISLYANNFISQPLPLKSLGLDGVMKELQLSPATIPNENNPAVEEDQLKVFMNIDAFQLNYVVGVSTGTNQPGTSLEPPVSKAMKNRPGTGPSDLTLAISSKTFGKIFHDVLNGGTIFEIPAPALPVWPGNPFATQPWGQYGASPIYVKYKVGASLAGGNINLQNPAPGQPNGSIQVSDLKVLWNELKFEINIDLPKITVGAFHTDAVVVLGVTIVPAIDFSGITLFGGGDIKIPIDLSPMNMVNEISFSAEPVVYYGTGKPGIQNCPNRWMFYVVPQVPIFVWPVFSFDLNKAITDGINNFFNGIFGNYPGPIVDTIKSALEAALTGIFSSLSTIFSDLGSLEESIVDDIVNDVPGIKSALDKLFLDYLTNQAPIFELQDPFPNSKGFWGPNPAGALLQTSAIGPNNISLPMRLAYLGVTVDSSELTVEGDIAP